MYEKLTLNVIKWSPEDEERFRSIKDTLLKAPVLSLPDLNKPFQLFVDTSNQTAYGVLIQDWAEVRNL